MTPIEILPANAGEQEWAAALMAGSEPWITLGRGLDACRARCGDLAYQLYIAHQNGRPCGFILIHPHGVAGSPYVASIAVADSCRSQGCGTRMLDFAEELFRGNSRYIFLCVSSINPRARELYLRRGYSTVGELTDYVIDGASEYLMCKRLRQP